MKALSKALRKKEKLQHHEYDVVCGDGDETTQKIPSVRRCGIMCVCTVLNLVLLALIAAQFLRYNVLPMGGSDTLHRTNSANQSQDGLTPGRLSPCAAINLTLDSLVRDNTFGRNPLLDVCTPSDQVRVVCVHKKTELTFDCDALEQIGVPSCSNNSRPGVCREGIAWRGYKGPFKHGADRTSLSLSWDTALPPPGHLKLPVILCQRLNRCPWLSMGSDAMPSLDALINRYRSFPPFIWVTINGDISPISTGARTHWYKASHGAHEWSLMHPLFFFCRGRLFPSCQGQNARRCNHSDNSPKDPRFLDLPNLVGWFSQNALAAHPKLHGIPIGLNGADVGRMKMILDRCQHLTAPIRVRKTLLFINFGLGPTERNEVFWNVHRWASFAHIAWPRSADVRCPECKVLLQKSNRINSFAEYLTALAESSFTFSPPGSGWDCYRTWEALYLGSVPILLRTGTPFDDMYADLPVLFVDSYQDVTESMLLAALTRFQSVNFNWEKITARYWRGQIERTAAEWARGR